MAHLGALLAIVAGERLQYFASAASVWIFIGLFCGWIGKISLGMPRVLECSRLLGRGVQAHLYAVPTVWLKRTWPALLISIFLAEASPLQAQFSYTANGNALIITGYSGPGGAVTIPNSINNIAVTSIGYAAFYDASDLTSVVISDGVTNIANFAFENCANLTGVSVPEGVANIGDFAFYGCESLTNFVIPATVTSVGDNPFGACSTLMAITVEAGNTNYSSVNGVLFRQGLGTLIQFPGGIGGNYAIPEGVTNITDSAFDGCTNLVSLVSPASVVNIGDKAFEECASLASDYFMGNAPTLGSDLFDSDNDPTVYYLPGTTGWNSAFTGVPNALWNPLIEASGSSFGVFNNQFGFYITGTSNIPIRVEACTNLANPTWVSLRTTTLSNGLIFFSEPLQTNSQSRFYRISSP